MNSFAKLNLGLEVLGRRPDGYHEIRTLFQSVNLADLLEFVPNDSWAVTLQGDDRAVPWDATNLIFKAAQALRPRFAGAPGVDIRVTKRIPPGKGLGGGSSNAAVTLMALNRLWRCGLRRTELELLAASLGSDVAYFLQGGLCLGEGRGERVTPLPDLPTLYCVIALPEVVSPTARVYGELGASLTSRVKVSKMVRFFESRELAGLENDLEVAVFRLYPQLKDIKRLLERQGAELSLVTGSGSAVFGVFSGRDKAERGWNEVRRHVPAVLVETLARDQYAQGLDAGV